MSDIITFIAIQLVGAAVIIAIAEIWYAIKHRNHRNRFCRRIDNIKELTPAEKDAIKACIFGDTVQHIERHNREVDELKRKARSL